MSNDMLHRCRFEEGDSCDLTAVKLVGCHTKGDDMDERRGVVKVYQPQTGTSET